MSEPDFGIGIFGGRALLFCEIAVYEMLEEEADVQGVDVEARENVRWMQAQYDLSENPPTDWMPWRNDESCTSVDFANGKSNVLRCSFEEFTAAYRQHLEEHTTRFPERN